VVIETLRPEAGDIGFSTIGGAVGAFVAFGQLMLADASRYTHTFVVAGFPFEDEVIEAMPNGARRGRLRAGRYARLPVPEPIKIANAARDYLGRPYGFSTYASLAAVQWGVPARLLRRYVSSNRRMICSQLVDQALSDAGVHLFSDGRIPQDVTPGDVLYALGVMPGTVWFDWEP
jgi:hypothetical protein